MALSSDELTKRVSVLRKLKENLLKQREKFQSYLVVLEAEKNSIEEGKVESLQAQVNLEESIVAEIFTFQKVIDPLEEIYQASYPEASDHDEEVRTIKASLETLKSQVQEQNKKNRTLLSSRMEEVRQEMLSIRRPGKNLFSSSVAPAPSLVDITT